LLRLRAVDAIKGVTEVGFKEDTLVLDSAPREAIQNHLETFDPKAAFVSEEYGWSEYEKSQARQAERLYVTDELDKSKNLQSFLQSSLQEAPSTQTVAQVLESKDAAQEWERIFGGPIIVTGSTSALTCIQDGLPEFSLMINHITKEIVFASEAGILRYTGPIKNLTIGKLLHEGESVQFLPLGNRADEASQRFVAFTRGDDYQNNLVAAGLCRQGSYFNDPAGPPRPLYLSSLFTANPIGFIVSNGEKIGEWIHWLVYVRFARYRGEPILKLYEVMHGQSYERNNMLMSPGVNESLFIQQDGTYRLACNRLLTYERPGLFRSTLAVAPKDNQVVVRKMSHCSRLIHFS
jgi:hypothetical protein